MPPSLPATDSAGFRYQRLADELEHQITTGVYKAGEKLPSIRKLCRRTGLSLTTVYQAFIELEKRKMVEARQKSGYFVRPLLGGILPAPGLDRHPSVPKRVSVNSIAGAIVEAMGDQSFLQLGGTVTAPALLPVRELSRIVRGIPAERLGHTLTRYENPCGSPDLRRQIAKRSLDFFAGADIDDIVITSGCIEAVSLCLQAVAGPGDTIVVESPTYPWFLQLIEDLNMLALEVPTDPRTGIDLASLTLAVAQNPVKACILVPNFHNPMGCLMPDEHKRELVTFLNRKRIPVIEDDIHGDLHFGPNRPSTLKAFDRAGLVLYCSSFSKTVAPGLRIGWTLPGRFIETVRRLKLNSSIASSTLNQHVLATFLKDGAYDRHLRRLRQALKLQAGNLAVSVARHFPDGTRITRPQGGLTLWVELPGSVDSLAVFHAARRERIAIMPGAMCSTLRKYRHCIRLSCGFPWSPEIEDGIRTLGEIIVREIEKPSQN